MSISKWMEEVADKEMFVRKIWALLLASASFGYSIKPPGIQNCGRDLQIFMIMSFIL